MTHHSPVALAEAEPKAITAEQTAFRGGIWKP